MPKLGLPGFSDPKSPGRGLVHTAIEVALKSNDAQSFRRLVASLVIAGGLLFLSGCQGLMGNNQGSGTVTVDASSLNFGAIPVGTTKTISDTLTNGTSSPITISSIVGLGSGFQITGVAVPLTVAAGQSVSFNVQFSPVNSGDPTITIGFDTQSSQTPVVSVNATGTAVTAGQLSFTPSSANFGSVTVGSSKTIPVVVSNMGGADIQITLATLSGAGFAMGNMTLPLTISGGATTTVSITFAPTSAANFSGSVTFATNSEQVNSSQVLSISGAGIGVGTLAPNPSSIAFGSVTVGSSSAKTETLTNTGGSSLTISQATASGAGFSISGLTLPVTLATNQSVSFTSTFTPTTAGAVTGSVSISSNGSNSTLSVPLSGTGVTAGTLTANPTSVGFGNVTDGTNKTTAVVVTNSGGTAVSLSSASASGTGFSFTGPALPATLNPGQTATFNAIFAPTAAGASSGTLAIKSNASNTTLSVSLSGTGVAQGQLGANPASLAFGSVQIGKSTSLTETLTNSGGTSISISAASASGSGYSLSGLSLPLTLNAGQSTSFTVTFPHGERRSQRQSGHHVERVEPEFEYSSIRHWRDTGIARSEPNESRLWQRSGWQECEPVGDLDQQWWNQSHNFGRLRDRHRLQHQRYLAAVNIDRRTEHVVHRDVYTHGQRRGERERGDHFQRRGSKLKRASLWHRSDSGNAGGKSYEPGFRQCSGRKQFQSHRDADKLRWIEPDDFGYVATFGEGHNNLFSPSNGCSRPPEKKNVTCGYFSVSAIRICFLPAFANTSPNVLFRLSLSKITCTLLKVLS